MYNSTVLKMKTLNVLHFYIELQEIFFLSGSYYRILSS